MDILHISKIARNICALDASGIEKLFSKYQIEQDDFEDLEQCFIDLADSIHINELGNEGYHWWNKLWKGEYDPNKIETQLITRIAGSALSKILKRVNWMETIQNQVHEIAVDFNKIDLNNIEENALKELRTKVVKANAAVKNYDKVKEKVKKELNTMLSRLDKTSKMVKDRELSQEMFEDLKSAMESILAEVSTDNYFVISDEDKTAIENAANTLQGVKGVSSTSGNNVGFDEKLEKLEGEDAVVTNTVAEIGYLSNEIVSKIDATIMNDLKRQTLSINADDVKNQLIDTSNPESFINKYIVQLNDLNDKLTNKKYKDFNNELNNIINDPQKLLRECFKTQIKGKLTSDADELRKIQDACLKLDIKKDFEGLMELFKKDINDNTPMPNGSWRVTTHAKEARIAMKIAKSLM